MHSPANMTTVEKAFIQMGTVVRLKVTSRLPASIIEQGCARALHAFSQVESACSRFDEASELRRLSLHVGEPVAVSQVLFAPLQFALTMADLTHGLFDPTIGRLLHSHGFNRHYLIGNPVCDEIAEPGQVSYRDIMLDESLGTVTLLRPLTLDLGAVAKGFAVDWAARELRMFEGFTIDAGGDVYVGGYSQQEQPWSIAIRHPLQPDGIIHTLRTSNAAICTSGGYERISPLDPAVHHLIHPRTGTSPKEVLSSTVVAPYCMMADAFSTIALLLGSIQGIAFLEEYGSDGLLVDQTLTSHMTKGMKEYVI